MPPLMVVVPLSAPSVPLPETASVPLVTVVPPVCVFLPVRITVPSPPEELSANVILPACAELASENSPVKVLLLPFASSVLVAEESSVKSFEYVLSFSFATNVPPVKTGFTLSPNLLASYSVPAPAISVAVPGTIIPPSAVIVNFPWLIADPAGVQFAERPEVDAYPNV
ncbi:hypothetical protein Brsp04_03511 [Brucella sp. NBRC 12952]